MGDLDRRSTSKLAAAIRGVMRVPAYRPGAGAAVRVPGLPLETNLVLGGVDLNQFLQRSLPRAWDAVGLFESYLDIVLFPDEDNEPEPSPWTWFVRESGLTHGQGRWLLPVSASPMDIATVLLWLCAKDLPSELTANSYVVTTEDGDKIGFADGLALSEFERLRQKHPPCDFVDTLATKTINRIGYSRTMAFNALWVRAHSTKGPDREALKLALQIIYWRSKSTTRAVEYLYGI